jgi:hypothetical protein
VPVHRQSELEFRLLGTQTRFENGTTRQEYVSQGEVATFRSGSYVVVSNDPESNGEAAPRIIRFLTREAALAANPALAKITLQPQEAIPLPIVPRTGNLFR